MNDDWLDERIRQAYAEISLPEERIRRMVGPKPRSWLPGLWVALAAAAVLAVIAWPSIAPSPEPEPEPVPIARPAVVTPAPATTDEPAVADLLEPPLTPSPPPPKPAPAPVDPAPEPAATAMDVEGLWIGSTSTGSSFKLVILDQDRARVAGNVEAQTDSGHFVSWSVTGKVTGDRLVLTAPDVSVTATIDGRRLSGVMKPRGRSEVQVSAIR